ncbi:PP2C family protein-serine/threonine phosphatase [Sulfitobacter sp. S190]|uniref:PP2C family protein-serine/threonine phosphatase n=1 Tax=Sulfitobacter sp. S190 TaxID=2867022 RepID=UPI0021A955B8|nr:SpoIIE family protein phosphatase [Sulfitobacter sp. S190]UWR22489.1 SpoIIE family protein phosphatase [Sulfitobacter sp. S190]
MFAQKSAAHSYLAAAQPAAIGKVLVVDDSRLQRRLLCAVLKRWGFGVIEAGSGEEALQLMREQRPDLVISDWIMPGMTGLELCGEIRRLYTDGYCYFILLTSKSDKEEVAQGLDSGADDFLTKPVDNSELRARIAAGSRLLAAQRDLSQKNAMLRDTLDELQRVYDHIDKDLLEAKKLQQSLLRERFKHFDAGDLSLMLRSSGHVGGDLVGFFNAGVDHLGLFAIDVSGHGISSALMTARLAGYLSAANPDQNVALSRKLDGTVCPRPPADAVAMLNDLVLDDMDTEHYFTLMLGFVELSTGKVTLSQAGHPHPVIQRADGSIEQDGTGGFPVGLLPHLDYESFTLQLNPGDRLCILSDGVTECPTPDGFLEEDGLADLLDELREVRGPALLEALVWRLTDLNGSVDFTDDISGIVFDYRGQPAAT